MKNIKRTELLKFSKIYSVIFHPFIIPTIGVAIMLFGNSFLNALPLNYKISILGIVLLNTFVLPAFCIYMLYRVDFLKNLSLNEQKERQAPLMFVIISYLFCIYMLTRFINIEIITRMLIAGVAAIIVCMVVNLYWKISLHTTAMGGLVGMIIGINILGYGYMPISMLAILALAGLLGTVRLYMGKHNIAQVATGFATGIMATILALYI